jgi:hypothetical protein
MKNLVLYVGLLLACALAFAQNTSQQEMMKKCNADAGTRKLKGDERKKFMSECLKAQ